MIIKKNNVDTIDVELYGKNSRLLENIAQKNGIYLNNKLPYRFEITAQYRFTHLCSNCGVKISKGNNNNDFVSRTKHINTEYYSKEFVLAFLDFFKNTGLVTRNGYLYIYDREFNPTPDPLIYLTPSIRPSYYSCPNCGVEFLSNSIFAPPLSSYDTHSYERFGFLDIKEIVQIELENGKTFGEWGYENRIYKKRVI